MPTKQTQENALIEAIAAKVLNALQGQTATVPAPKPATTRRPSAAARAIAKQGNERAQRKADRTPRTIQNPEARATIRQVYKLAAVLFEAHYGESLPNPLTMGDVQAVLDDLSA